MQRFLISVNLISYGLQFFSAAFGTEPADSLCIPVTDLADFLGGGVKLAGNCNFLTFLFILVLFNPTQ